MVGPAEICLWILLRFIRLVFIPVSIFNSFRRSENCPPISNKILLLPASVLAERIRKKEISSADVVQAYISRVQEVNPILNAVLQSRFVEALDEAKKADALILSGSLNEEQLKEKLPLLGVPITIKGSIAVAGMTHTAGRVDLNTTAPSDGISVKHVREAGAIPILISNVPELCLNWETRNKLIGTTRNPYNTTRTVGGSSGGEACLLASAASVIGMGSDIGGSLRLPAHFCGIWGHKPSPSAVSCVGHYPTCSDRDNWDQVFTLGPLTRYATDLKLLLNIMVEPDAKKKLKLDKNVDVTKLKVYYIKDAGSILTDRPNRNVSNALEKVISHLNRVCENNCTKVKVPILKYAGQLGYLRIASVKGVTNLFEGDGEGVYSEIFRFLTCRSKHEFTTIFYGLLRRNYKLVPKRTLRAAFREIEKLRNFFIEMLGEDGVFICPTELTEAHHHGESLKRIFNCGSCCTIYNALGFPATHCPITLANNNGLPVGIQVVAAPNCDRLTLRVAEELEQAFGGWQPPNTSN